MAIEANQPEICRKMINIIDTYCLKTEVNKNGKNALKLVTEIINKGAEFQLLMEVEKQILEKTKQKVNNYRNQQELVDKSKTQVLRLFRGTSCFGCGGMPF